MWYYVRNSQRIGPVEQSVIEELIHNGTIVRQTLVWKSPMSDWKQAGVTELADKFADAAPEAPLPPAINPYSDVPIKFTPQSLRKMWFWCTLLCIICTPSLFTAVLLMSIHKDDSVPYVPLIIFAIIIPAIVVWVVLLYKMLYRFWLLIQDGNVRTTPGKAVGFCFIPFFNVYWNYVAFVGLAKDMYLYCQQRNIDGPKPGRGLALTWFIVRTFACTPYIGFLAAIPALVLQIILTKQFVETSVKIMEHKNSSQ
jgi:hypothetical protein